MYELYNSDCFPIMNRFISENKKFNAIIADVPYNINYSDWDNGFDIKEAIKLSLDLLTDEGNLILFQGWSNVAETYLMCNEYGVVKNWIVWDRIKGRGAKHQLVSTREDILWVTKTKDNTTFNKIPSNIPKKTKGMGEKNGEPNRALTNIWYDIPPIVPWSKERNGHPTQKPLALMERIVSIWTNEGDTILDFTCGSGTTGEAAVLLGRNFVGIEIDKQWADFTNERLIKATMIKKGIKI